MWRKLYGVNHSGRPAAAAAASMVRRKLRSPVGPPVEVHEDQGLRTGRPRVQVCVELVGQEPGERHHPRLVSLAVGGHDAAANLHQAASITS